MDQRIINSYDRFTHSPTRLKELLKHLALLTGSTAAAMTVLPLLQNNYAAAAPFHSDDITTENVTYAGVDGDVKAVMAKPTGKSGIGGVVVIHENRGLNPHIIDVTKRIAAEGFIALGVDALSPFGGTPDDEDKGRELIGQLDMGKTVQNYQSGLAYLRTADGSNGKVGCVGFCWGGAMAGRLAVSDPNLQASVAYYGSQPNAAEVPAIKASLMLHYAGLDERINAGIPAYEEALKANDVNYQLYVYEGVNHAFNNDTSPTRYDAEAAKLAWSRTVDFFKSKLA